MNFYPTALVHEAADDLAETADMDITCDACGPIASITGVPYEHWLRGYNSARLASRLWGQHCVAAHGLAAVPW